MVFSGKSSASVQNQEGSPHVNRFFKVMFGNDIQKLLYLPPRFSRTMGRFDGQETHLEDSMGIQWPVTLSQVDGSLAFQEGWSKFSDHHGLKVGHFLVFTYTNVSHFRVHIFGESAHEITSFGHVTPLRRSKRLRTNEDTIHVNSMNKALRTDNVIAVEKPRSNDSVPSKPEFWNSPKGISMDMEDPCIMINRREEQCNQGEGSRILYDLSCFEMQQTILGHTNDVGKSKKPSATVIDAKMAVGYCAEKGNKSPKHTETPSSHYVKMNQMKMAMTHENQKIHGYSGDELADKLEKASDIKTDQNKMTPIHSKRLNANPMDFSAKKFVKPSDNSNTSKTVKVDMCNGDKIVLLGESRFMDSSKIAAMSDDAIKTRCPDSSLCRTVTRSRFGQPAVNEQVKLSIEARGQKPIKAEPDLPYDTLPSGSFSSFSVEVKSQSYLELPVRIPSAPGRSTSGRGKVLYLRDPAGRLWPILYQELYTVKAFMGNWTRFCKENSIMPGDECMFHPENGKICAYRVDVRRSHIDGELPK